MMTKLTRVRLHSLYDALFKAQESATQLSEEEADTEAGKVGKEADEKLDELMMNISSLLADDGS